jgi:SRSO17 transposase
MTKRVPCPPAPGPLEGFAARFDDLFGSLAQRRGFREYLAGLLAPRDRNKTLTALAGAEPVAGAQHPVVQRLQFFLSESRWDPDKVNERRLELLLADPATAPHGGGVLVLDDSGDRKEGVKTAHVGHQWLGRYGKTDNGVVTVTTVWADERVYYPVHAVPYTPARHFAKGKSDPAFRTKLAIGADLAVLTITKLADRPHSRSGPGRRGSRSARWPPTAPTGIRTGSALSWPRPGCRS